VIVGCADLSLDRNGRSLDSRKNDSGTAYLWLITEAIWNLRRRSFPEHCERTVRTKRLESDSGLGLAQQDLACDAPGGLHVGYMNGMRPHGIVMHEGVFHDGKLQGEAHFRGIGFSCPTGVKGPRIEFILKHGK
jgi:hypothetical protein